MAWNPNIPTVTNRVQDDLDAIRENFQHLDQIAERVDELQTVSELAPIANNLQAVSGLAPVANDLQTVSGLAPVAGELQTVSELAPYVQAIRDSRIVEMGSNSNGEYVRWENGLQICFVRGVAFAGDGTSDVKTGNWTHPAAFASPPAIVGRNAPAVASPGWYIEVNLGEFTWVTDAFWRAYRVSGSWSSGIEYYLHYIAIGRWK